MTTIGNILDSALEKDSYEDRTDLEQVALACYMLGETRARKQISDRVRDQLDEYPNHRYHNLQREVKRAALGPLVQESDEQEIRGWKLR